MAVGRLWAEVWTRPGAATYERKIADLSEATGAFTKRHTGVGSGSLDLPKGLDDLDQILVVDPDTPANSVWSTIKVFAESDPDDPVFEWLPDPVLPAVTKNDDTDQVSGAGIESVVGFARVEPYDWDGSDDFVAVDADWNFGGGANILLNPSFENESLLNGGFELGTSDYWQPTENTGYFSNATAVNAIDNSTDAQAGDYYGNVEVGSNNLTGATRTISGLAAGQEYTITGYLNEPTANGDRYLAGVDGCSSASHTNWFLLDDVWFCAELDNAPVSTGAADGTWQTFTLTFIPEGESITLAIFYNDTLPARDFRIDSWAMSGPGAGLAPWYPDLLGGADGGYLDEFDIDTTNVLEGSQSAVFQGSTVINPESDEWYRAGIAQDVNLNVGKTYTFEAWVYHEAGSDQEFRVSIRQQAAKGDTPGGGQRVMVRSGPTTVADSTWTKVICTGRVDKASAYVKVHWVYQGASSPTPQQSPRFWVDQCSLKEGLPPTTVGDMFTQLYDHAIDVDLRDPIVWDDGQGTDTPYLTLDFDETNDSGGNAWDNDEVGLVFNPRMSYLQVLARMAALGYQWRVVPDSTPGYYELQLYNPGGLGTTQGALQTGSADISKQSRFIRPASDILVQGQQNISARDRDSDLLTAFGRIEQSILDLNIGDLDDGSVAAADALTAGLADAEALVITTVPLTNTDEPLIAYDVGDTVSIGTEDGLNTRQLNELEVSWGKTVEYTHKFGSVVVSGPGSIGSAVNYLLTRFERADQPFQAVPLTVGGGGGMPTVVVAASDASELSKSKADFICGGTDDDVTIRAAIDLIGGPMQLVLTEGNYDIPLDSGYGFTMPQYSKLLGMGVEATYLISNGGTGSMVLLSGSNVVTDIAFQYDDPTSAIELDESAALFFIMRNRFTTSGAFPAIIGAKNTYTWIKNNQFVESGA